MNEKDKGISQKNDKRQHEQTDREILDHIDEGMKLLARMVCGLLENTDKTNKLLERIEKKDMRTSLQYSPFMAEQERKKMEIITVINNKLGSFLDQWEKFTK